MRTIGAAITVTVIDAVIALPVAFYMAKVAAPWARRALVVSVTMPLWAGYLVKGYAWRAILDPGGGVLKEVFGHTPGFGYSSSVIVLSYLWFPYMVIPIYAGLDRLPNSLLEASTDLGAKAGADVRQHRAPAGVAGARRRLDLHVRPDAGRLLHEPRSSAERPSSSATSCTASSPSTFPSRRRTRRCRS